MGHIRLGRLPKSARWREVVGVMESDPQNAERIAAATLVASEDYLRSARNDPALGRAYWTLVRLMAAARGDDFAGEVSRLGVPSESEGSSIAFLAGVADSVRRESAEAADGSMAGELGGLALQRALMETVGTQATSMFGSTVDDLQAAFRAHSTERQFGEVSRLFFGDFLARVLRGALDREAPRLLGASASEVMLQQVDVHARQSAAIVRDFAGEWFSKKRYERAGDIRREDADGFIAVALRKLRSELRREGEQA